MSERATRVGPETVIAFLARLGGPGEAQAEKVEFLESVLRQLVKDHRAVPEWWEDLADLVHQGQL